MSAAPNAPLTADSDARWVQRTERRCVRVLTLTPFYPSLRDSARGCFIAEPVRGMEALGISSEVIAVQPFFHGREVKACGEPAANWKSYFALPGNLGLPTAGGFLAAGLWPTVRKMHARDPFNLIHAHAALPCGHAATILSLRLHVPFIVSVHGLDAFSVRQAGRQAGPWCKRVSERVYRSARAVICISEKVRSLVSTCSPVNARVVYNAADPARFCPGPETRSPLIVLSVGNLIPIKGHALLLAAFAKVAANRDVVLEVIGDGPERRNLERDAQRLGIAERVRFLGRKTRQEVADALRRCAVFALPSSYEGLGCVYLEAMVCGKSVIGCRGQGIDEVIEHGRNGALISPGDGTGLENWLGTFVDNETVRARMGEAARQTILQNYTLAHQSERLAELYRECAL